MKVATVTMLKKIKIELLPNRLVPQVTSSDPEGATIFIQLGTCPDNLVTANDCTSLWWRKIWGQTKIWGNQTIWATRWRLPCWQDDRSCVCIAPPWTCRWAAAHLCTARSSTPGRRFKILILVWKAMLWIRLNPFQGIFTHLSKNS